MYEQKDSVVIIHPAISMPAENMDSAEIIPGWDGLITYKK